MSEPVNMTVTMELLSDAIFGSGFSIPGGEDVAVCRDETGYPYLKGSAFKGLLRESLENWLAWTGGDPGTLAALLGESGWEGAADGRRVRLTELRPVNPPADPEDCFSLRTFTALEGGVVKQDTLRTASCIRAGLRFQGELECAASDAALLQNALSAIKWAGTLRSRGFGRVRVTGEAAPAAAKPAAAVASAACLRYWLRTASPVLVTDLARSRGNGMETRLLIPGGAVRGMVVSALAESDPEWFAAHRAELLRDDCTRFLDAVPVAETTDLPPLPSLMGFYEDKEEKEFETLLKDGSFSAGLKRAKLGSFCAIDGNKLRYWSAASAGATRIGIGKGEQYETDMFQTRCLAPGQTLEGYILLGAPELAERISRVLSGAVWLGADRYGGFGRCEVTLLEAAERPRWLDAYGFVGGEQPGTELYLLAVSPFTMLSESGEPCGLDEKALAAALGVGEVRIGPASTSVREYGGYNRTWRSRVPAAQMYDRGSVFHLYLDRAPAPEALQRVQREGVGIRRAEGFGQVLFLRPSLIDGLEGKEGVQTEKPASATAAAALRRARCAWVMEHAGEIRGSGLSPSQVGTLQALCEKGVRQGGDTAELDAWLEKNLTERGVRHAERFKKTAAFLRRVLNGGIETPEGVDTTSDRLALLCMLFNFSRKNADGKGETE